MNTLHKVEALSATVSGGGILTADMMGYLDHAISALSALAGLAWWFRIWLKDPNKKPPGLPAIALGCFAALGLSALCSGCASNHTILTREVTDTNGVVTVSRSDNHSLALWPATGEVDRQRIANTPHGQSIGVEGLSQQGGGSNVVEALRSLDSILGKIKP